MERVIARAGAPMPNVEDEISQKEEQLAETLHRLDEVNARETELKLRVLELQDRLGAFRSSFRMMQNEIANTAGKR